MSETHNNKNGRFRYDLNTVLVCSLLVLVRSLLVLVCSLLFLLPFRYDLNTVRLNLRPAVGIFKTEWDVRDGNFHFHSNPTFVQTSATLGVPHICFYQLLKTPPLPCFLPGFF